MASSPTVASNVTPCLCMCPVAVIKPLGRMFRQLKGISGSTILGSGEVALILDIAALVALAADGEDRAGSDAGHPVAA